MTRSLHDAINEGVAALARMQSRDGSFPLWTGTSAWRPCGPLFSTAYILMGEAGALLPPDCIDNAVHYILRHRRSDRLWDYDPALEVPPDSDVAACCLAALARHGDAFDLVGGTALLQSFWRRGPGPFRTWNAQGDWSLPERDDPVVNCNIMFALRLLGAPIPSRGKVRVLEYIQQSGRSRYYRSPATIAHASRRASIDWADLPAWITVQPPPNDFLSCAQWLCAAPERDGALAASVLSAQRPDGSWPVSPWVTAAKNPRPFWGSPAVSTALAIEGLYRQLDQPLAKKPTPETPSFLSLVGTATKRLLAGKS